MKKDAREGKSAVEDVVSDSALSGTDRSAVDELCHILARILLRKLTGEETSSKGGAA